MARVALSRFAVEFELETRAKAEAARTGRAIVRPACLGRQSTRSSVWNRRSNWRTDPLVDRGRVEARKVAFSRFVPGAGRSLRPTHLIPARLPLAAASPSLSASLRTLATPSIPPSLSPSFSSSSSFSLCLNSRAALPSLSLSLSSFDIRTGVIVVVTNDHDRSRALATDFRPTRPLCFFVFPSLVVPVIPLTPRRCLSSSRLSKSSRALATFSTWPGVSPALSNLSIERSSLALSSNEREREFVSSGFFDKEIFGNLWKSRFFVWNDYFLIIK